MHAVTIELRLYVRRGPLIYLDKGYGYEYTCSPPCQYACQSFDAATPPFDMRKELNGSYIMLVDRGPLTSGNACVFVEKVWNAQQAGARGVIVVNYDDTLTTMDAPDGDDERSYTFLENITSTLHCVCRYVEPI